MASSGARLKVYRARMGFADTVVAAPNQKAALAAWGSRQNLFAEGLAAVADDPADIAAALARPGEVLQRAVGGDGAFGPGPADPPPAPRGGAKARAKPARKPRPPPDRSGLDAAEAALRAAQAEEAAGLAQLERRRAALEAEARELRASLERRRREAEAAGDKARRAFAAAGGKAAK